MVQKAWSIPMRRDTCETDTTIAAGKRAPAQTGIRPRPERASDREWGSDRRHWLAVASADHARRGRALGIMQVCHGKAAPLRRIRGGDGVVYYSPTVSLGGKDRLRRSPPSASP